MSVHLAGQTTDDARLAELYERDAWFELRDAIEGKAVAPLYAGAVASAFNRVDQAEQQLTRAVREATTTEGANEARGKLSILYIRDGKLAEAGRVIDEILKAEPGRADVINARMVFGAFPNRENQIVERRRAGSFRCVIRDDGVWLPVEIGRLTASWLLDTGANISVISEQEAKRLGFKINEPAQVNDLAGGTAAARTTTAPRLTIGNTELRNVPMLVLPDDRPPFNAVPLGVRGLIGLPVALALQSVRWTKPAACATSEETSTVASTRNLAFNGLFPIVRTDVAGRTLAFVLESSGDSTLGAVSTRLYGAAGGTRRQRHRSRDAVWRIVRARRDCAAGAGIADRRPRDVAQAGERVLAAGRRRSLAWQTCNGRVGATENRHASY